MISTSRTSDFRISGSAISSHKNIQQTRVTKKLLSEDEAEELSDRLIQVKKGMVVTIRYFKEDTEHPAIPPLGIYDTITGKVEMIDAIFRQISINDGQAKVTIHFDDLEGVSGEGIVSIDDFLGISESDGPHC